MKPPSTHRRGAISAFLCTAVSFLVARSAKSAPPARGRWRKLSPEETVELGDRYANRDPGEIAKILENPAAFPPGSTDFFTARTFLGKEVGYKVKNILILDPDAGYWRFETV